MPILNVTQNKAFSGMEKYAVLYEPNIYKLAYRNKQERLGENCTNFSHSFVMLMRLRVVMNSFCCFHLPL